MPEHVFREVHPDEFEKHIQHAAQTNLDQLRDYTRKKTYLNQDNTVGYALRDDGYWGNLFSFVKGGGFAAAQDAIARGALWGTAFDRRGPKNLIEHYKAFGLKPFAREKNWEEGGPDMVYVKFDHAPIPDEVKQKIEQGIAHPEDEMAKTERRTIFSLMRKAPHPHAYEWHDGHTLHHKVMAKADLADEADVGKQFQHQLNEQVATVGVPTYIEYAKHYGTINKAIPPHGSAYDYRGLSDKVNDLIRQHGYEVYYAGGKYGKPDLATKNYDTKHLMIYDPTPDSGGDQGDLEQTDNWRKVHELAHALTREAVNNAIIPGFGDTRYGERPRMGRLGKQRTLRDAMRAIHWEALAVQKQRELSEQLGVKIPDEAFNMEWNTNQHDATHRAVTGRFSEPRKEGFHPSSEPVPLEFSLGLARKAAEQMGMKGLDDLKSMTKNERLLVKTQELLHGMSLTKAAVGWGQHPQPQSMHVQQQGNEASYTAPSEEEIDAYWKKFDELQGTNKRATPPRGTWVEGKPTLTSFDYTNALPEHLRRAGYRLAVQHTIDHGQKHYNSDGTGRWSIARGYGRPERHTLNAVILRGSFKNPYIVAHSMGEIQKEQDGSVTVEPHTAATAEGHLGQRLGYMTIRTVLGHAVNYLGATHMVHGYSTADGVKMRSRLGDEYKTVVEEPQVPIPEGRNITGSVAYAPETSHQDLSVGFEQGRGAGRAVQGRAVAVGGRTALVKTQQLLKALKDLPRPQRSTDVSRFESHHDYTHMLPDHLRQQGYEMMVEQKKSLLNNKSLDALIYHPVDGPVAHVYGYIFGDSKGKLQFINPHANGVHPDHQFNKLGFHAYEAMLNHAYNHMGVTQMRPGPHSGFAEKVHRALAAKHGFKIITPAPKLKHPTPYDAPSAHPDQPSTRVMITHDDSTYGLDPEAMGDTKVAPTPESTSRIGRAFNRVRSLWQRGERWMGLVD